MQGDIKESAQAPCEHKLLPGAPRPLLSNMPPWQIACAVALCPAAHTSHAAWRLFAVGRLRLRTRVGWIAPQPACFFGCLRLHRLLDDDDNLLDEYRRALAADLSDCCPGVVHIAHTCAAALDYPDDLWLPSVLEAHTPLCVDSPAARCVQLGLLPFGAWAVGAAYNCHEARSDPELHRLTLLAADPAPWVLMSDLIRACQSYHASICAAAALESGLNAVLCLPALLRRVLTSAVQDAAHVWDPFDSGCRLLLLSGL